MAKKLFGHTAIAALYHLLPHSEHERKHLCRVDVRDFPVGLNCHTIDDDDLPDGRLDNQMRQLGDELLKLGGIGVCFRRALWVVLPSFHVMPLMLTHVVAQKPPKPE